ncbi:hypothetical protein CsatA_020785 [Cannabis sativa]|uniref:Uncharacterized protein n=1 Tax=Cannabis sativa TaxID=3483 RepID=A0A803NXK1_CANSA
MWVLPELYRLYCKREDIPIPKEDQMDVNVLYPWPYHKVLYRNNEGGVLSPLRHGWMIFGESLSEVEFVEGAMDYVHRIPIIEEEDGIFQRYFELTEEISNYRSFLRGLHLRLSAITGH